MVWHCWSSFRGAQSSCLLCSVSWHATSASQKRCSNTELEKRSGRWAMYSRCCGTIVNGTKSSRLQKSDCLVRLAQMVQHVQVKCRYRSFCNICLARCPCAVLLQKCLMAATTTGYSYNMTLSSGRQQVVKALSMTLLQHAKQPRCDMLKMKRVHCSISDACLPAALLCVLLWLLPYSLWRFWFLPWFASSHSKSC